MAAASIPSISGGGIEFGLAATVYTNRKDATYTHNLDALLYTGGEAIESKIARGVATSVRWIPDIDLMKHIPNAASVRARIRCYTYNGSGSLVGLDFSEYFDIRVPTEAAPVIDSFTAAPIGNGVPGAWGLYIQGYSQAQLRTTAYGRYGAAIKSYQIRTAADSKVSLPAMYGNDVMTGVLTKIGQCSLTVTVTDSRGLTSTQNISFEVTAYGPPRITDAKFERCLADGTPNDDGTYLKVFGRLAISSCKGKNSYTATVQYRVKGAYSWQTAGNYTTAATKIYNINMSSNIYEVRIALKDGIQTSYSEATLDIGTILYEYDPDANILEFTVPIRFPGWPPSASETGTYTGQGRTGSGAQNTIAFEHGVPKLVLIQKKGTAERGMLLLTPGAETGWSVVGSTQAGLVVSASGNTVSWYYNSADSHPANQLDTRSATYTYVAVF